MSRASVLLSSRSITPAWPVLRSGSFRILLSSRCSSVHPSFPAITYCFSTLIMSKQTTLGSFFGKPNGQKGGPVRQTTLAFVTRDKSTKSAKTESDEKKIQTDKPGHETGSSTEAAESKKKYEAQEDDDDEPPVKRQRRQRVLKSTSPSPDRDRKLGVMKEERSPSRAKASSPVSKLASSAYSTEEKLEAVESVTKKAAKIAIKKEEPETDTQDDIPEERASETETETDKIEKEKKFLKFESTQGSKNPPSSWKPGTPVPYSALCQTFSKIEMTTKRLEILDHCSLFLRQVLRLTPDDLLPTVLLMVNKLAADYAGIELGIGESLLMKAIGESTGRSLQVVKADHHELGDLGLVAAKSRLNQRTMMKPKPLTVRGVHQALLGIATTEGTGAQTRKVGSIMKLLASSDAELVSKGTKVDVTVDKGGPSEAKYIVRALEGKMRLGLAERTVLVALAQAFVFHHHDPTGSKGTFPSAEKLAEGETILKTVYSELPSYEMVVPALLKYGIFKLPEHCQLQPGIPLKPMLAKPTKSITEVLDRFENKQFTCEYKYDGERAQIHYIAPSDSNPKGLLKIFSRNSEDLSSKYPDILSKLNTWIKPSSSVTSFVLDCETVGWDSVEKKVLPFQQLMTRKRKDVKVEDVKVKVCVFGFDILYLNGEPMVRRTLRERRAAMHDHFNPIEGEFGFASAGDTDQLEEIQTLLDASIENHCEGLMVKMLDGPGSEYAPSRRSQNWLKVKKDYLAGVGDSLDLVVVGAYHGRGKRTSKYGAFLLACYDPSNEQFETICNIGTGFSDTALDEMFTLLSSITIERPKPFYVHSSIGSSGGGNGGSGGSDKDAPDVWFEPQVVWEVKTADLTLSPRYRAAINLMSEGKGVSLRFPRFIRVRDDKKPEQATTSQAVAQMYWKQASVAKSKGPAVDDDFEY